MKKKTTSKTSRKAPYTPEEVEEIRMMLLREEDRISGRLAGSKRSMEPVRQVGDEAADVSGDNAARDTGMTLMAGDSQRLRMIQDSLAKLRRGEFGICHDCGRAIGMPRLRAKPYAKYCVDCKEKREQQRPEEI